MGYLKKISDTGWQNGDLIAAEAVTAGKAAAFQDNNVVKLADGTGSFAGLFVLDAPALDKCTVAMDGGIYETDTFAGSPAAGDDLFVDPANATLTKVTDPNTQTAVARALSVEGGTMRFRLFG